MQFVQTRACRLFMRSLPSILSKSQWASSSGASRRAEPFCNRPSNHKLPVCVKAGGGDLAATGGQQLLPRNFASLSAIMRAAVNLEVIKRAAAA